MKPTTAALILAATACAMTTVGLLVLILRPDLVIIAAIAVYIVSEALSRWKWSLGLVALALVLWAAAQRYIRNGDPR